jgi:hypothetical protein
MADIAVKIINSKCLAALVPNDEIVKHIFDLDRYIGKFSVERLAAYGNGGTLKVALMALGCWRPVAATGRLGAWALGFPACSGASARGGLP